MNYEIGRADVWAGEFLEKTAEYAEILDILAKAGASLEFVIVRRLPEKPGRGVIFLAPIKGARQMKAANAAGLAKTSSLHSVRVVGADKAGLGARMLRAVHEAGLHVRAFSAAAVGKRSIVYIAFNAEADAKRAVGLLKKQLR